MNNAVNRVVIVDNNPRHEISNEIRITSTEAKLLGVDTDGDTVTLIRFPIKGKQYNWVQKIIKKIFRI